MTPQAAPRRAVIQLHPQAPTKPAPGQPCNGCGWCCSFEPCPLGRLVSRRRQGRCLALTWDEPTVRYHCGAVVDPARHLRWLRWLPEPWTRRLALRWIAATSGCDATIEAG